MTTPLTKKRKIEVLKRARQLIARPSGWAKGRWVNNDTGRDYPALCLGAACQQAAIDLGYVPEGTDLYTEEVARRVSLSKLIQSKLGFGYVPHFNDHAKTRKKDVLAVIDEKIAELSA